MVSAELQVNKITGLELEEGWFLVISPRIFFAGQDAALPIQSPSE